MKIAFSAATLVMLTIGAQACAYDAPTAQQGKTREQARQELLQAYKDGVLPFRRAEYPPSAASMKKNKDAYARVHPAQDPKRIDH
ncbi:hypothetical protein BURK_004762 [Burkholderia sp. SJ98]|nr:hypothetical protein BURK_004762 [Burkholderia sp. SJ98]